ncbi:MAG: hypothetical protein GY755_17350 [Chloroflexi bacterium]|nr:hypothetical protein [Chloroflexota bacterium]
MKATSLVKSFKLEKILPALLLGFIVLAQISSIIPSVHSPGRDSGIFLYIGDLILDGKIPYVHAWENKGPLIFYLNALGLLIGKGSRWGVWLIEFLFLFFAACVGYKLTKKAFGLFPALLGSIVWVFSLGSVQQGGNLTEQYSILFSFVGIACYLWGIKNPQMRRFDFIFGVSFGLSFLLRPNNIGVHLAGVFSFLLFLLIENNWKLFLQRILYMSFGGLITILPPTIYFINVNALEEFYKIVFLFNTQYSNSIGINQIVTGFLQGSAFFGVWVMGLTIMGYLWILIKFVFQLYKNNVPRRFFFFLLIYWPIEIVLSSLSGRNYPHYFISWIPVICLSSAYLFSEALKQLSPKTKKYPSIILVITLFTTLIVNRNSLANYFPVLSSLSDGVSLKSVEYIHPVAEYIQNNTHSNDYVLVWGFRPSINFMANREAPSAYLAYPAMHEQSQETYAWAELYYNQLRSNKPVLVVDMIDTSIDELPSLSSEMTRRQTENFEEWVIAHNYEDVIAYIEQEYVYDTNIAGHAIYKLRDIDAPK